MEEYICNSAKLKINFQSIRINIFIVDETDQLGIKFKFIWIHGSAADKFSQNTYVYTQKASYFHSRQQQNYNCSIHQLIKCTCIY